MLSFLQKMINHLLQSRVLQIRVHVLRIQSSRSFTIIMPTMIATGHNSNIIYVTELQNIPQGACTQLKRLYWVISSRFIPNLVIS